MNQNRALSIVVILSLLAMAIQPAVSSAQGVAIPKLNLQSAIVAAAGNEIHLNQVTFEENGKPKTVDIVITLRPSQGKIQVHDVSSTPSEPALNRGENFIAGTYADLAGNKYSLTGGALLDGGRVAWSLRALPGGVDFDASWATGPREGNPITNYKYDTVEGVSFGIVGLSNLTYPNSDKPLFLAGLPIAAAQIGDSITIYTLYGGNRLQAYKPQFQLQFRRVSD